MKMKEFEQRREPTSLAPLPWIRRCRPISLGDSWRTCKQIKNIVTPETVHNRFENYAFHEKEGNLISTAFSQPMHYAPVTFIMKAQYDYNCQKKCKFLCFEILLLILYREKK